jgi:hypothetical protein
MSAMLGSGARENRMKLPSGDQSFGRPGVNFGAIGVSPRAVNVFPVKVERSILDAARAKRETAAVGDQTGLARPPLKTSACGQTALQVTSHKSAATTCEINTAARRPSGAIETESCQRNSERFADCAGRCLCDQRGCSAADVTTRPCGRPDVATCCKKANDRHCPRARRPVARRPTANLIGIERLRHQRAVPK